MVVHVCAIGLGEAEAGRSDQEEPRLYRVLQDSLTQHTSFIKDRKRELHLGYCDLVTGISGADTV